MYRDADPAASRPIYRCTYPRIYLSPDPPTYLPTGRPSSYRLVCRSTKLISSYIKNPTSPRQRFKTLNTRATPSPLRRLENSYDAAPISPFRHFWFCNNKNDTSPRRRFENPYAGGLPRRFGNSHLSILEVVPRYFAASRVFMLVDLPRRFGGLDLSIL